MDGRDLMGRAPKKCGDRDCEQRGTTAYCPTHTAQRQASSGWGHGSTRQSRRERAQVLAAYPTCYLNYDGCTIVSTDDDHVVPLSQGGSDALDNRRGACSHCHRIKSQREAQAGRHTARRTVGQHPGLAS